MESNLRVGIVGAGIAGLVAGRRLSDAGADVTLLDKGRDVGGRCNTRCTRHGDFDHGAQYFTVRQADFKRQVAAWCAAGVARRWDGCIVSIQSGSWREATATERFVGVPGMRALGQDLARSLDVRRSVEVVRCEPSGSTWELMDSNGHTYGPFETILITTPAPQAVPLLTAAPQLAAIARRTSMVPCWTCLCTFDASLPIRFDAAFVDSSPLSWVARDSSKPGRAPGERWVLHGSPEWSQQQLESSKDVVADQLLQAFWAASGCARVRPRYVAAHRWRFARGSGNVPGNCLWDAKARLGAAGDWCCDGQRVEDAYSSGVQFAQQVLGTLD